MLLIAQRTGDAMYTAGEVLEKNEKLFFQLQIIMMFFRIQYLNVFYVAKPSAVHTSFLLVLNARCLHISCGLIIAVNHHCYSACYMIRFLMLCTHQHMQVSKSVINKNLYNKYILS